TSPCSSLMTGMPFFGLGAYMVLGGCVWRIIHKSTTSWYLRWWFVVGGYPSRRRCWPSWCGAIPSAVQSRIPSRSWETPNGRPILGIHARLPGLHEPDDFGSTKRRASPVHRGIRRAYLGDDEAAGRRNRRSPRPRKARSKRSELPNGLGSHLLEESGHSSQSETGRLGTHRQRALD